MPPGIVRVNSRDGLEYVWIPPGAFLTGAAPGDKEAHDDGMREHPVRISRGFWLGRAPVTVGAYKQFAREMGRRMPPFPDFNVAWKEEDHPVVNVTWYEAKEYCEWAGGRLPAEAEWEYAARGGEEGLRHSWEEEEGSPEGTHHGDRDEGATPVKTLPSNVWELYDMGCNLREWVADWYGGDYYSTLPLDRLSIDPQGPESRTGERVVRGGSWISYASHLSAAYRDGVRPGYRHVKIGFRCALEVLP